MYHQRTVDEIVDYLVKDITGRKGIGDEFEAIDDDICNEMLENWKIKMNDIMLSHFLSDH